MYEVPRSPELSNAFAAKAGTQTVYPDQVLITSDGGFLPVFYKYENGKPILDKNGRVVVDQTLTHPVSMQDGRIRLAKELFGQTGVKNIMKSGEQQQAPKQSTEKTYKAGNKSYTHKQLLDLGYTEEQIQQAIKLGNLK
jgi:hypothetical protein